VFSLNPGGNIDQFINNTRNSTLKALTPQLPTTNSYPFCPIRLTVLIIPITTTAVSRLAIGTVASSRKLLSSTIILLEILNNAKELVYHFMRYFGGVLVALII
jgi:hypothetical protein